MRRFSDCCSHRETISLRFPISFSSSNCCSCQELIKSAKRCILSRACWETSAYIASAFSISFTSLGESFFSACSDSFSSFTEASAESRTTDSVISFVTDEMTFVNSCSSSLDTTITFLHPGTQRPGNIYPYYTSDCCKDEACNLYRKKPMDIQSYVCIAHPRAYIQNFYIIFADGLQKIH